MKKVEILEFSLIITAILAVTVPATMKPPSEQASQGGEAVNVQPHFSVRWMGLAPDSNTSWPTPQPYNNNYSDYYACINDVISEKLYMPLSFRIVNQENSSFYFRILQDPLSPAEWSSPATNIGLINKDATKFFTFSTVRTKPSSIPEGRLSETIILTFQAYYDSSYTQFYSQDNVPVTFNFIDRTAPVWTTLSVDNFDTSAQSHWTGVGAIWSGPIVTGELYRSWPNSLVIETWWPGSENGLGTNITINSSYTEAYVITSVKSKVWLNTPKVTFNGTVYFEPDVGPTENSWYQLTFPLPTNQTTEVGILFIAANTFGYFDDAYVIARAT